MHRLTRFLGAAACVFGAATVLICTGDTTAPDTEPVFEAAPSPASGLEQCEPQPYAVSSARIGPSGGTLRVGRHMLRIPAGSLKKSVRLTMEAPSDTLNYVVFQPEGLTFDPAHPPTLTMSYRNCPRALRDKDALEIVYVDDALQNVLETTELVSADTTNAAVHARLRHFSTYVLRKSRYAVAY